MNLDKVIEKSIDKVKNQPIKRVNIFHIYQVILEYPEIISLLKENNIDLDKVHKKIKTKSHIYEGIYKNLYDLSLFPDRLKSQAVGVKVDVTLEEVFCKARKDALSLSYDETSVMVLFENIVDNNEFNVFSKEEVNKILSSIATKENEITPLKKDHLSECENLYHYSSVINKEISNGIRSNMYERVDVIDNIEKVLLKKEKANPLLVGESGCGKTSLVYSLTERIINKTSHESLFDSMVISLDIHSMLAGSIHRGEFEKRFKGCMDEIFYLLKMGNKVIVFIDEMHSIFGLGGSSESNDLASILKPYLENPKLKFLGATTFKEYNQFFEKSSPIKRRVTKVNIPLMDKKEVLLLTEQRVPLYEEFHQFELPAKLHEQIYDLLDKHQRERNFPDKMVDFVDTLGVLLKIKSKKVASIDDIHENLEIQLGRKISRDSEIIVLESVRNQVKSVIFGQDHAIDHTIEKLQESFLGIRNKGPLAKLFFRGPTGVGKTELCLQIAKYLGYKVSRFDMSEYSKSESLSKLIGSEPGYVGYEEGGRLTEEIKKYPQSIIVFDEIEKAHPKIHQTLLQVMDYGQLTDSRGMKVDFNNSIIIFTSNVGAVVERKKNISLGGSYSNKGAVEKELSLSFAPEFLNRLDEVISFNSMDREIALKIANYEYEMLKSELKKKGITVKLTIEKELEKISDLEISEMGGRGIRKVIQKIIKAKAVKKMKRCSVT
jgi:ATP-dependent Clp protease ATP-binding subunit ClpA